MRQLPDREQEGAALVVGWLAKSIGEALRDEADPDPQFADAVKVVIATQRCSTSWIQRQLGLGYNRAARIVETVATAPAGYHFHRDHRCPRARRWLTRRITAIAARA